MLLHVACQLDKVKCAEMLLTHGAYINAFDYNNYTPLHLACHEGSMACTELLLKMGAVLDTPRSRNTPLTCT
ncbi:hypothetical protein CDAR_511581 [Caerostris darwini]|uniref:Uncharacterized protein n=1 Tax=Caerostris darwini TaxID=1538125 RepID=A0AAV4TTN7_9ARAC|nr:hypothetical protein CDAR_511581 [Caerostris darwini]